MFKKVLFTLCFLGSVSANACDVQLFDGSKEENKVVYEKLTVLMDKAVYNYDINTVDIDNDGKKDYLLFLKSASQGKHGQAFIGVKENKEHKMQIIRTGYVPVKDDIAQCDSHDKIVFYPTVN